MKCKVCGKEFAANNERHYVARENVKTGAFAEIAKEEKIFDAFDCPYCGCQLIAQERKHQYVIPNEVAANEEEEHKKPHCYGNFDEEGGIDCDGCEYGEDCVREEYKNKVLKKLTCIGHCDEECECD